MAIIKALLISLGEYEPRVEEEKLKAAGFSTAHINWKELQAQENDWMQITSILQRESIRLLAFVGDQKDITPDILSKMSLISLSSNPTISSAFIFCEESIYQLPESLQHFKQYHSLDPFGAKLMADCFKKTESAFSKPFYIVAHLDSLIGLWLEIGVKDQDIQDDFLIGVTDAKITAFGIGKRGEIPGRCTLSYPLLGIEGSMRDKPFSACASQDNLSSNNACYCKIEGLPSYIFLGRYPNDSKDKEQETVSYIQLA